MVLSKKEKKVLVVFIVLVLVVAAVVIVLAALGILTGKSDGTPDEINKCQDCSFQKSDWKIRNGDYSATKKNCGTVVVNLADNFLSIKREEGANKEGSVGEAATDFSKKIPGLDDPNFITLSLEVDKTVSDNETMTVVFSDTGREYAGCGNLDATFFNTKPSGEAKSQHLLWTRKDNPTYLPFYLSRDDQDRSICIFADAQGVPIQITVKKKTTEWLVYSGSEVKFYGYRGDSTQDALNKCITKWKTMYPISDATWTDDVIVGSLTSNQVKADLDKGTSIASHYILSPDVVTITGSGLGISDKDSIADYSNVFLPLSTKQKINGITATEEKGYYSYLESDGSYILDYDNSAVQTTIRANYLQQSKAGIIIDGFLNFPKGEKCPKYFHCSGLQREIDGNSCLGAVFGDGRVFEKHNLYDVSMRKALQPGKTLVIETAASPGTSHFHRTDLELTEDGLKTCYHNIFNLRKLGIGSVTCNLCAGVVPSTDDQKSLCFRWSQLTLLMPYLIISSKTKATDLTDALSDTGNEGFMKMKKTIELRKQLHHYLAKSRDSVQDKENGIVFGDDLFMVVNLNKSPEFDVQLPAGEWVAPDSTEQAAGIYFTSSVNSPQKFTNEEDITKLMFYKLDTIFVLKSKDNDDHVEVHIFQLNKNYIADETSSTFTYNKHRTDINLNPTSKKVTFTYTAATDPANTIDKDKFKVSKLVVHYWIENVENDLPKVRSYSVDSDNGKYNVVFNYASVNGATLNSIFSDWTENLKPKDDEGS